jgi:hypothetical protein
MAIDVMCLEVLLTRRSQEAQLEAGRKDQPDGSPAERRDPLGDILAGHMDLGVHSFAEALRTVRTDQLRVHVPRQVLLLQLCARHRSHLQSCVSIVYC